MQVQFTTFRECFIRYLHIDETTWVYVPDLARAIGYSCPTRMTARVSQRGPVKVIDTPQLPAGRRTGRWASLQALTAYAERATRYRRKPASADLLDWLYVTFNLKSKPAPQPVTGLDEAIARVHRDVLQLLGEPTP